MPTSPGMSRLSTATSNPTVSTPGAFAVEGYASRERNRGDQISASDIESRVVEAEISMCPASTTVDSTTPSASGIDVTQAYLVQESEIHGEATIVKTWCGIDQKYAVVIAILAIGATIAIVLGVDPPNQQDPIPSCGPLCGSESISNPEQIVLGLSCEYWNLASLQPDDGKLCDSQYGAAAYACGCPNVDIPSNACGGLCSRGEALQDPDKVVKDVHGTARTCGEWELIAKFDTRTTDACANYNAVGVLCGCQDNVPPPDACGPLCADNLLPQPSMVVWGQSCEEWNTMASFLPVWGDETCSQIFQDVAYRCECPEVKPPPDECNILCQERSFCGASMCQDDSPIPYPDKVVRGMTCKDWSFFSRLTDHEEMCYFYEMIGAECGCDNTPTSNACGPLCGNGQGLAHPSRKVRGQRCDEWDSMSTFLFAGYGEAMPGTTAMISSTCDAFFSPLAYGCGCPLIELPSNGCGFFCKNGLPLPDPQRIIEDQTCGDLELKSLFETNPDTCYRYSTSVATQCGCADEDPTEAEYWSQLQCFSTDNLNEKTFFFFSGMTQYSILFGGNGKFVQIQNQDSHILVGRFADFETIEATPNRSDNSVINGTIFYDGGGLEVTGLQANYGGGYRCGLYGPRRGSVVLIEDDTVVIPKITSVIEPSTCVYRAILHVPPFCK